VSVIERHSLRWLAWELRIPLADLRRLADTVNAQYRPFLKRQRGKKPRPIDNPKQKLKFVQRRVRARLLVPQPLPEWMHGCVQGKSPLTNAAVHQNQPNLARVDVKRFFPSVTHRMVYDVYRHAGLGPKPAHLLTILTTWHGHLPQGAPTSDRLANLMLVPAAHRMEAIFQTLNLKPSAFVDDIAFSGSRTREAMPLVIAELREVGLAVSHAKSGNAGATQPHRLTGYVTNGRHGPKVSRKDRSTIRAVIHRFICARRRGEAATALERSVQGRLAHLRRTNLGEARRLDRQLLRAGIDLSVRDR
jgi:hypothetical protein